MFVKAAILRGDERGTNVLGHRRDRDVDAANVLEMTEQFGIPIVHVSTLAGVKRSDFSRTRTTIKAAAGQPGVERENANAGQGQQAEPWPVTSDPPPSRVVRIAAKPLLEDGGAGAEEGCDHAKAVRHSK